MKSRFRSIVAVALIVALRHLSVDLAHAELGDCADIMTDINPKTRMKGVTFGDRRVNLTPRDYDALRDAERELRRLPPGTVVYAPVVAAEGPILLRMESQGGRKVLQAVSGNTAGSSRDFETLLERAAAPTARAAREQIRAMLKPPNEAADAGKTVLVVDLFALGTVPEALGLNAPTVAKDKIAVGARHRRQLGTRRMPPSEFTAIVGYPTSPAAYEAVFRGAETAPLESWRERVSEFEAIARETGLGQVIGIESLSSKAELLRQLEEARGIICILAHANRTEIRLAGGEVIEIRPEDIARLSFKHAPVVVLRVCYGSEHGFQEAFRRAGAIGVFANSGPVDAAAANRDLALLLRALASGKSVWDAVNEAAAVGPAMSRTRVVQVFPPADLWPRSLW